MILYRDLEKKRISSYMTLNKEDLEFILEHLLYPVNEELVARYWRIKKEIKAMLKYDSVK